MGDAARFHETIRYLFLGHDAARVLAADGYSSQARIGTFEAIFHLIKTALRREDGDVVIIVSKRDRSRQVYGEDIYMRKNQITRWIAIPTRSESHCQNLRITYESRLMVKDACVLVLGQEYR